jgi:hypothetical protein
LIFPPFSSRKQTSALQHTDPHFKAIDFARALSLSTESLPIRFIAILQQVSSQRVDLEPLRQCLVRLDIAVGELSQVALKLGSDIPGTLLAITRFNPALQARHLLQQTTKFQAIVRYRSAGCACKVIKPIRPFIDTIEESVFLPIVPTEQYPIAVEVSPNDNATVLTFQFVSKFMIVQNAQRRFLLRIANFSFKTTSNRSEYIQSVNWNCVLWFWCRRVSGRDRLGSLASIMAVAASLLRALGDRFEEPALRAVCALSRSTLFAGDPGHCDRVVDLLSLAAPRQLQMVPRVDANIDGRTICQSVEGIAEERNAKEQAPSREARELQIALPVYVPVSAVVQPGCVSVDPAALADLQARAGQ